MLLFIAKQKNEPVKHPVEMFNGVTLGFLASLPLEQLGLPPDAFTGEQAPAIWGLWRSCLRTCTVPRALANGLGPIGVSTAP